MDKVREIALKVLYKIEVGQAYSNIILDKTIKQNKEQLNLKDISLIYEIVYGVTTWKITLDEIIKKYSKIKIKKISLWILSILRMGIYQIIFLDKIPKSAAVNESVNLAKKYGHVSSKNFVNAILRKVNKKDFEDLFNIKDIKKKISVTTSVPVWIIDKLLEQYSINQVEKICNNLNLRPNLYIRVNTLKITKNKLKELLIQKGINVEDVELENFLCVNNLKNIENFDLFIKGLFTVQDLSAGLVAVVLEPKEGNFILDACSAPGGKTTQIAEIINNNGKIQACDIHKHRVGLVKQNAKRLGIDIIKETVCDMSKFNKELQEKFDKILLDVPCLGIGAIRRKPDIKWKKQESDVKEIIKLQYEILSTCSKYLKKGGELVYSTCSILKEENEDIIEKFLKENKNFSIVNYKQNSNYDSFKDFVIDNKYISILPSLKYDGFFICKIKRDA